LHQGESAFLGALQRSHDLRAAIGHI
jgi:hypothetical protein